MKNLLEKLLVGVQYLLPQNLLSAGARCISQCRTSWFKNAFIRIFVRLFRVDLEEAESSSPSDYPHFNAFFTRALKPGSRPLDTSQGPLVCPCDGRISQLGRITRGRIFQAKDRFFTTSELIGDESLAQPYLDGWFLTIYLAPRDYHRVHMPCAGRLEAGIHIPGKLFSVNERTARQVPRLFARNERLSMIFRDEEQQPLGLVMVAAMLVSGIETVWSDRQYRRTAAPARQDYPDRSGPRLAQGAELGRFHWGSTVILLAPASMPPWNAGLQAGSPVRLGQALNKPGGVAY